MTRNRQACAINHRLPWDKRNTDAFQCHVEVNFLLTCFACKRVGHRFSECLGKDKEPFVVGPRFVSPQQQVHSISNVSPSPSLQQALLTQHRPPFCAQAQPASITEAQFCGLFNQTGRCVNNGCPLETHKCNRSNCRGEHAGVFFPSCRDSNKIFNNLFVPLPNRITTPVNVNNLSKELEGYPVPEIAVFLVAGFTSGFSLACTGSHFALVPKNSKSALDNETHVTAAIIKELDRKHMAGPFLSPPIEPLHCSPLGAVPKKDGSWHLISDLSSPRDYSVNEYISKEEFSVILSKFDDALNLVRKLG